MKTRRSEEDLAQQNVAMMGRMEDASREERTLGERVADRFAAVVGSWAFIIVQTVLMALWVGLNVVAWVRHWDPYPFILLNLALSFQAAYAGPIIMMSQNRQSRMTERRNQLDLQINLLAEQETTEILRLLRKICEKQGIGLEDEAALRALTQKTRPEEVVKEIRKVVEKEGQ